MDEPALALHPPDQVGRLRREARGGRGRGRASEAAAGAASERGGKEGGGSGEKDLPRSRRRGPRGGGRHGSLGGWAQERCRAHRNERTQDRRLGRAGRMILAVGLYR